MSNRDWRKVERRDLEQGQYWGGGGASLVPADGGDWVSAEYFDSLLTELRDTRRALEMAEAVLGGKKIQFYLSEARAESRIKQGSKP